MAAQTDFSPNTKIKSSEVTANFTNTNTQLDAEHNTDGTHGVINLTAAKGTIITLTDEATININLNIGTIFKVTITDNRTFTVSNPSVGQAFTVRVTQDGGGSNTVTWFGGVNWVDSVTPTLTTTGNKTDVFGFICVGSGVYDGFIVGKNL